MARLIPSDTEMTLTGEHPPAPEARTLARLQQGLSDQYTVFHGVHWARAGRANSAYGEIDFIIASRWGRLLAIEQKDTQVIVTRGDLFARYQPQRNRLGERDHVDYTDKSITTQVNRNLNALRGEFSRRYPGRALSMDHLLYLPAARVEGVLPSSVDPARVVDADRDADLIQVIESLLDDPPENFTDEMLDDIPRIHGFLSRCVDAVPDIGVLGRSAREVTRHLSGGLSIWAERLTMQPWRLQVRGTAGSGKTQLALQALLQAHEANQAALYVCFNRSLADAMKPLAPNPQFVVTFHELARTVVGLDQVIDFSRPGVFDELANGFIKMSPKLAATFDTLVIDEGQDLDPSWAESLLALARPDARMLWLEDPEQSLYQRPAFEPSGWVRLSSPVNYRSPQKLIDFINCLGLTEQPVESGSSVQGFDPYWLQYEGDISSIDATADAVATLVEDGFSPANIAVLSFRGAESANILGENAPDLIAGHRVRRHVGFDAEGNALWTDGDLLVDTVFRFKGQAADAVVITEIDFAELTPRDRRKLFVGLTRARLQVALVTSRRAADVMIEKLA